jgi:methylase of polypeptide subunit release factors
VSYLINRLRLSDAQNFPKDLRVLDLCTGTGCIPLLFSHDFPYKELGVKILNIVALDISKKALSLASYNQQRLLRELESARTNGTGKEPAENARIYSLKHIRFLRADVLDNSGPGSITNFTTFLQHSGKPTWDIVISNPPYVSPKAFASSTSRSVRNFEPKLALVPPETLDSNDEEQGDLFYPRLLDIGQMAEAKMLLVEVADLDQAMRVAKMAQQRRRWSGVEIWRDQPDHHSPNGDIFPEGVRVIGQGNGRSVFCYTQEGREWISKCQ